MAKTAVHTIEIKVERVIPAPPDEVFDAWLNPKTPGTPWHESEKLLINPKVDGLFYMCHTGRPHFGRFVKIDRPSRIQHTWMSQNTLGEESLVTVTFKKQGKDTVMTLLHSDLPDNDLGRLHEDGWTYYLDNLVDRFGTGTRRRRSA